MNIPITSSHAIWTFLQECGVNRVLVGQSLENKLHTG